MTRSINSHRSPYLLPGWRAMWNSGRIPLLYGLLTLTAMAGGCQRGPTWDLAPVEGTVTKDGQPLTGIEVTFMPEIDAGAQGSPPAQGTTDKAGHYRLRNHNGDEGAVVGKYRVVLKRAGGQMLPELSQLLPEMAKRLEKQQKPAGDAPQLPASYERFDKTPLRVEVRSGEQIIDLEVK